MEKEEIACYEQFLLFPQCFQKLSVIDASNEYLWSKGLTSTLHSVLPQLLAAELTTINEI